MIAPSVFSSRWSRSQTPQKQNCSLPKVEMEGHRPARDMPHREFMPRGTVQSTGERAMRYRRYLTAAMTVAAFVVNVPAATAQPQQMPQQQPIQPPQEAPRIGSAMDEAVKGLDAIPRFKKLSPQQKKMLVEFVTGNTLFVLAHEI